MMRVIGIGVAGALVLIAANVVYPSRLFDSETRLGIFESRIAGVADEFMRRSEPLARTFLAFQNCGVECDSTAVRAERDRVIRAEWPQVFGRLAVRKDWGAERISRWSAESFFAEIEKRGASAMRDECVPKIAYRWPVRGNRKVAEYSFEGYDCSTAGKRPRR